MSLSILIHSNAPWCSSGYGKQTRYIAPRLKALGHKVTISAFHGLQAGVLDLDGFEVLPAGVKPWGNDIIEAHAKRCKADMVIAIIDPWVLSDFGHRLPGRFYPWFPVDGAPAAPQLVHSLSATTEGLVYSQFGMTELRKAGLTNMRYVPVGFEEQVFFPVKPTAEECKRVAKESLNIDPNVLLFTMVAANQAYPTRKCFEQHIDAFQKFHAKHPRSILYIHTDPLPIRGGINIYEYLNLVGLHDESVRFPNRYEYHLGFAEPEINRLYNATDLYLGASAGEGFGAPLVEAQACGTPVVTTKATATEELCGAGWLVPPDHKRYYQLGTFHFPPDSDKIYEAMEEFVESDREKLFQEGIKFSKRFTYANTIKEDWLPVLHGLEKRIFASAPVDGVVDVADDKERQWPKIAVVCVVGPDTKFLARFLKLLSEFDYPRDKLTWRFTAHPAARVRLEELLRKVSGPPSMILDPPPQQYKTRREEIYSMSNYLLSKLQDEEYVLLSDSDLIDASRKLLKSMVLQGKDIIAPMVVMDEANDWFYDTWGFRKNGVRFSNMFPYFKDFRWDAGLIELDSVGSFYLMKREIADKFRYTWSSNDKLEHGHVQFCKEARDAGYHVFTDSALLLRHARIDRGHTEEGDWEAPPIIEGLTT